MGSVTNKVSLYEQAGYFARISIPEGKDYMLQGSLKFLTDFFDVSSQ